MADAMAELRLLVAELWEAITTARCQGCPNRVRIIGWFPLARRRESAYCRECLSLVVQP